MFPSGLDVQLLGVRDIAYSRSVITEYISILLKIKPHLSLSYSIYYPFKVIMTLVQVRVLTNIED